MLQRKGKACQSGIAGLKKALTAVNGRIGRGHIGRVENRRSGEIQSCIVIKIS